MTEEQRIRLNEMTEDFLSRSLDDWLTISKKYEHEENPFDVLDEMSEVMEEESWIMKNWNVPWSWRQKSFFPCRKMNIEPLETILDTTAHFTF